MRQPLPGEPLRVALQAGVPAVVDAAPLIPAQSVPKPSPRPKPAVPPHHHPVLVRPGLVPKALPLPTKQAAFLSRADPAAAQQGCCRIHSRASGGRARGGDYHARSARAGGG
ncbi:hypothetical protein [Paludibacterium denitrificans]|uniref:Uncharacterized protein n=1 Tax=Paludibacterium denitrificans TaxID=2675226 RepID=A0A844GAS5_9NEIS|nr:hypothetical protein [Paludibacterium denitrificans]MTD32882.1 hypothetical protein [Paludibacterium denitrificans]